jgi:hypothetical protein
VLRTEPFVRSARGARQGLPHSLARLFPLCEVSRHNSPTPRLCHRLGFDLSSVPQEWGQRPVRTHEARRRFVETADCAVLTPYPLQRASLGCSD